MREGHASRTAEQNALFRALESARPKSRRLFEDPLARTFLTWPLTLVARVAVIPGLRELVPWLIDNRWPGVRSSVVARTRLIDDVVTASVPQRVEQLVILGAGFDSRAYRWPGLRGIAVFEADHPDTQTTKRQVLERVLSTPPKHVRFVALDFNQRDLASAMSAACQATASRHARSFSGKASRTT